MAKKKLTQEELQERSRAEEAKIDAKNATRTSKYDQELVRKARALGINPNNFHEEDVLADAVREFESREDK